MKNLLLKKWVLLLAFLFVGWSAMAQTEWQSVGSPDGVTTGETKYVSLVFNNGTPYLAFRDDGGTSNKGGRVMKLGADGYTWESVGFPFSSGEVGYVSLAFDNNGVPYVAYSDFADSQKATVKKLNADGLHWDVVGTAGFSLGAVYYLRLAIDNGVPYVAYQDSWNGYKAVVMKLNAAGTGWEVVGNAGFSAGFSYNISFAFDNGIPYVAYEDHGNGEKATVMKLNAAGTGWEVVGTAGFSAGKIDRNSLAFDNGVPYMAYTDNESTYKATVMKLNTAGTDWEIVGNADFSGGYADYISLAFNNGVPYVAFKDQANATKATVMKLNSAGTGWELVGNAGFSKGIAEFTSLAFDNGIPYVAYRDFSNSNKATVMKYVAVTNTIRFYIYDGTNPIPNASIDINSQSLTTNASGIVEIDLSDGSYPWTCDATGYTQETGTVVVSGAPQVVNVIMSTAVPTDYTVTFTVTDGTNPIQNASIDINSQTLTTNASGVATIDLPDGAYPWTCDATGFTQETGTVTVSGSPVPVNTTMTPDGSITWGGGTWTPNPPTSGDDVVITENYTGIGFPCNNLTIEPNVVITINTNECLEVAGEVTDNGNGLVLNDGAALVAPNNTTPVNGTYKKVYVLDPNGYGFAATPVGDFFVQNIFSGNYVYWYDESAPTQALAWVNLSYGDMFEDGNGYLFNAPATSKTYTGTFGLGTYTSGIEIPALSFTDPHPTPGHGGFNLIGNPYAAYLDWDGVIKSGLDPNKTVWIWTGTSYSVYIEGDNYGIDPAASFFVRADNASASVSFENQDTECTSSSKDSGFPELRLTASGNGLQDYLRVINPGDFEAYSAKMFTWNEEVPQIYIAEGEESYSIQRLDGIENGETIPVGFVCSQSGTYQLSTPLHGLGENVQVYLEDLATGSFTELTGQNTYTFSHTAGDEPNRFVMHFATTTTDVESVTETAVNIYSYAEKAYINTNGETAQSVEVYTLSGRLIYSDFNSFEGIRSFEVPATGVYIIKVQTENGATTERVVIN